MDKLKATGSSLLALLAVVILSGYTRDVLLPCGRDIELHQWIITTVFGVAFFGMAAIQWYDIIRGEA